MDSELLFQLNVIRHFDDCDFVELSAEVSTRLDRIRMDALDDAVEDLKQSECNIVVHVV